MIELMIVVAIISILATLALPKFQLFQAKAKFLEASVNLKTMITLSDTALLDRDRNSISSFTTGFGHDNGGTPANKCNAPNDLGFSLTNCEKINFSYLYSVGTTNTAYNATAEGGRILSGCENINFSLGYGFTNESPDQELFIYLAVMPSQSPIFRSQTVGGSLTPGGVLKECQ